MSTPSDARAPAADSEYRGRRGAAAAAAATSAMCVSSVFASRHA